jgi:hypothetical protein
MSYAAYVGNYDLSPNDGWNTTGVDSGTYPYLRLPDDTEIVGFALNGVFLFTGAENGYDVFYP